MALQIHRKDQHGNVVAEEGITLCTCGCKYWENDKCIDCGMTPERLWIIQHAERLRIMQRLSLNVKFATMMHYDLPWFKPSLSDDLDPKRIMENARNLPDYRLTWAKPGNCTECGGTDNDHYFSCSVWDFVTKKVV